MTGRPAADLAIGDFARLTHLTVKTLRHYHEVGLLEPAAVDPETGYRRYDGEQVGTALVIRRFRDLGMPVADVRAVLGTTDPGARHALIAAHLGRLESELAATQAAVASLRDLLRPDAAPIAIELRSVPATPVLAVAATVSADAMGPWWRGAQAELVAAAAAAGVRAAGPLGGVYADEVFSAGEGEATIFLPVDGGASAAGGRVVARVLPAVDLAVAVLEGPHAGADVVYAALGAYVRQHAVGLPGPVRESYVIGPEDTADSARWRTEIGWPVFPT